MLNTASGIAPRNGTNAHTIAFGFTAAAGSLLVVIIHGGVTHAAAGWTEQLSPVQSGELSVFTKTSAGDNSITVTHNAANYPVTWAAIEYPTGSAWVDGAGSNAFTDTWPTLAGLPGTPVTAVGARGRVSGSPGDAVASTAWNSPWTEVADVVVAHDGSTDGSYLAVGTAPISATSATPDGTTTYSWATADRQHVVFAIQEPAGGPPQPTGIAVPVTIGQPEVGLIGAEPQSLAVGAVFGQPTAGPTVPSLVTVPVTYIDAIGAVKAWINSRTGLVGQGRPLRMGAHLKYTAGGEPATFALLEELLSFRSDGAENPDMMAVLAAQVYGGTREAATLAAVALAEEISSGLVGREATVPGALLMVADDIQGPAWSPDGDKPRLLVNFTVRARPA